MNNKPAALDEAIEEKWHSVLEGNGGYQFSHINDKEWGALPIETIEQLRHAARRYSAIVKAVEGGLTDEQILAAHSEFSDGPLGQNDIDEVREHYAALLRASGIDALIKGG